jgi:hypothetical protein
MRRLPVASLLLLSGIGSALYQRQAEEAAGQPGRRLELEMSIHSWHDGAMPALAAPQLSTDGKRRLSAPPRQR